MEDERAADHEEPRGTGDARDRSVLLVDPLFYPNGGGGAVTAWAIQGLCGPHRLTVLAWRHFDTARLNTLYGTSLSRGVFELRTPAAPLRWILNGIDAVDPVP